MKLLQAIAAAHQPGMDAILEAGEATLRQLLALGFDPDMARKLYQAGAIYTGACSNPKKRAATIAQARAGRLNMEAIFLIESYAGRIKDINRAWDVRQELAGLATNQEIKTRGAQLTKPPAPNPEPGVRLTRREGRNWDLKITASSDLIAELAKVATSPESLQQALHEGGVRTTFTTNLVITPQDLVAIEAGRADEVRVQSTDGAWRTGAQVAQALAADSLRIILQTPGGVGINSYRLVPEAGAVDAGRDRHANAKQRVLAAVESPTCAMRGCNRPAEDSQVHHLQAWSQGGRTHPPNLCVLCPFHNGRNDDGPQTHLNGRMIRTRGRLAWRSPFGKIVYSRTPPPSGAREPEWRLSPAETAWA